MNTFSYNFFDLKTLHVHSENINLLEEVDKLFGNFRDSDGIALPADEEHVYLEEVNQGEEKYKITWNADTSNARTLTSGLFSLNFMVNQHILAELPFLFVHASVVSRGSDVLVFMGDSGYGKTTLCLALVSQGFKYLSDEYAVIDLAEGRIMPYPRCGLVSLSSLKLLQELDERFCISGILPETHNPPSPLGGDRIASGGRGRVRGIGIAPAINPPRNDVFEQDRESFINPWLIFPESQERRRKYERISLFIISPDFKNKTDISTAPQVEAVNNIFYHAKNLSSVCKIGERTVVDSVFQLVQKTDCFHLKQGDLADTVKLVREILETPPIPTTDANFDLLLELIKMRLNVVNGEVM